MADLPPMPVVARVKRFIRTHSIIPWLEGAYPLLAGAITGLAVWQRSSLDPSDVLNLIEDVLPTAVTVAAVLAGFQATAQSVLISLLDSNAWKYLQRNNHDLRIVDFHWAAVWSLLAFVLISLGIIVLQATDGDLASRTRLVPAVLASLFTAAVLCAHRVAYVMVKILRQKDGNPISDATRSANAHSTQSPPPFDTITRDP